MATVTALKRAQMSAFTNDVVNSVSIGENHFELEHTASFTTAYVYGPGPIGGPYTVKKVLFDDADGGFGPDFQVDGLNFAASIDEVDNMSLQQFLMECLQGSDVVTGSIVGDDLVGLGGNDILIGGADADDLDGGIGNDTASYATASAGLLVNMSGSSTGDAAGDTFTSIENLTGSAFNDRLYATNAVNRLSGGNGNDDLAGLGGGDTFDGGAGTDIVTYDASGAVLADLKIPSRNTNDAAGDSYIAIESLDGSSFNDFLYGNDLPNAIRGSSYPTLVSGKDQLFGRGGNDRLSGHDDTDVLDGGVGFDTMIGGAGGDRFDFNLVSEIGNATTACDFISDFVAGVDKIDLGSIDASTIVGGDNASAWKGTGLIGTSTSGEIKYKKIDASGTANDFTYVYGDTDKDTASEFIIKLKGLITLSATDFTL